MSTPRDEDRGPLPPRRSPAPPRKATSFWKWACGGCAVTLLLGCCLITVGIVAGINWLDDFLKDRGDQPVFAKHPLGSVLSVTYSPDGSRIATASGDGTNWIWNADTGRSVLSFIGGQNGYRSLAFSPDGTRLATGNGTVWDAATGKKLLTLGEGNSMTVNDLAYSPDGTRLAAACGDSTVRVWDANTGKELLVIEGHSSCIGFSPDGSRLVTGSRNGTVLIWNAVTGKEQRKLETEMGDWVEERDDIRCVEFTHDGKQVCGAGWSHFFTWDAATGDKLSSTTHQAGADRSFPGTRAINPGTNQLVMANEKWAHVWDLKTGQKTRTLQTRLHILTLGIAPTKLQCVAISPDGTRVVGGSRNGTIRVWKLDE